MNTTGGDPIDGQVSYDTQGLVPCVVQDWSTGEVLTFAYMNEEALRRTRDTGELHLWSRSRAEQWHKGATSGNVQTLRALRLPLPGGGGARGAPAAPPAAPPPPPGGRPCFPRGEPGPAAAFETLPTL